LLDRLIGLLDVVGIGRARLRLALGARRRRRGGAALLALGVDGILGRILGIAGFGRGRLAIAAAGRLGVAARGLRTVGALELALLPPRLGGRARRVLGVLALGRFALRFRLLGGFGLLLLALPLGGLLLPRRQPVLGNVLFFLGGGAAARVFGRRVLVG